jgi:hypothetical protein
MVQRDLTCLTSFLYVGTSLFGPSSVCFKNASSTDMRTTVSRVSRKTTKKTGTAKTSIVMVADEWRAEMLLCQVTEKVSFGNAWMESWKAIEASLGLRYSGSKAESRYRGIEVGSDYARGGSD